MSTGQCLGTDIIRSLSSLQKSNKYRWLAFYKVFKYIFGILGVTLINIPGSYNSQVLNFNKTPGKFS